MVRLFFVNLVLFIVGIILHSFLAIAIGVAMRPATGSVEVGLAYIAVAFTHIYVNHLLLKKRQLSTRRRKIISTILIAGAYIGYLFIYTR